MKHTTAPKTVRVKSSASRMINEHHSIDHYFTVPLNHEDSEGEKIEVFAREIRKKGASEDIPMMIFFQGGPGGESPRNPAGSAWIREILKSHRLLLLDQRGTGLSSEVLPQTLATKGDAIAQAEYLTYFRADSIVRDAECIRKTLIGDTKWKGVGQSYGGFCLLNYLSFYPEGLSGVIITGGTACVKRDIKENYRLTYKRVCEKNNLYYARYPEDEKQVREIFEYIKNNEVMLPSGVRLTTRRFQQLGMFFGGGGGLETMHYLIEKAFVKGVAGKELSQSFISKIERASVYENSPIFCILHESIYAEGYATNWAAEQLREEFTEFDVDGDHERYLFTGEMIAPSMLDDYSSLQPLKEVANILAQKSDWGPLYDLDQLAINKVPVSAIAYYDDMYVPVEWSEETAQHVGNFRIWVTNEWEHNGIGVDGSSILRRLMDQLDETAPFGFRG